MSNKTAPLTKHVIITQEVFNACATHALTTEKEEIMGLLLGDADEKTQTVRIWGLSVQIRSDRRTDRVEISGEQLVSAQSEAEQFTKRLGRKTRVVGWYHSHPHITILPSHVDNRTQYQWQQLDQYFVGLIFASFGTNQTQGGQMQLIGFQSFDSQNSYDVTVVPPEAVEWSRRTGERHGRVELPLQILPIESLFTQPKDLQVVSEQALRNLVKLQKNLFQEERSAYISTTYINGHLHTQSDSKLSHLKITHPLTAIHNAAVYQKSLCKILEYGCLPLIESLHNKLRMQEAEIAKLEAENGRMQQ